MSNPPQEMEMGSLKVLQEWCRIECANYPSVEIKNMSTSFRDGLAFCAIIHKHRPDLINFSSLSKDNVYENNRLAFEVAETKLGIPALLDPQDMVSCKLPDRLSVITYLSQYYYFFNKKSHASLMSSDVTGLTSLTKSKPPGSLKPPEPLPDHWSSREDRLSSGKPYSVCALCRKKVHLVQKLLKEGKVYHRSCFRCKVCRTTLIPGSYKQGSDAGSLICIHHITDTENSHPDLCRQIGSTENLPKSKCQEVSLSAGGPLHPPGKTESRDRLVHRTEETDGGEGNARPETSREVEDRVSLGSNRKVKRPAPPHPPLRGCEDRTLESPILANSNLQEDATKTQGPPTSLGVSVSGGSSRPVAAPRRILDSSTPPVPAPRTKTLQRMNTSSATGNRSKSPPGSSNTPNSGSHKVKSNHPWMNIVHSGPWTQLPPAAAPMTPPRLSWFRPREPPPNPFGEVVEEDITDDTEVEGASTETADQMKPSSQSVNGANLPNKSANMHAPVNSSNNPNATTKSNPDSKAMPADKPVPPKRSVYKGTSAPTVNSAQRDRSATSCVSSGGSGSGGGGVKKSKAPGLPGTHSVKTVNVAGPECSLGPGVPDLAGAASRPGVPDLAGAASGPGVPDLAGAASRPGVPDLAGAASRLGVPDLAGVASGPGVPDLAGAASRLGVSDLAGAASGPGVPDLAGVASRLGVPDLAGVASGPGVPDLAGVASRLGVPDLAGVASGPGVPDLAGVASRLGVPDLAGVASGPGVPDLAGVASRLGVPDLAGVASGPGVPDLAGVASRLGVPDLAGVASGPGVPDLAGVASGLGVPDLAGVASGSGVPDLAGVASRLGVPDLAGVASRPGVPDLAGVASRLGVPDLAGVASGPGVPDLAGVASRLGVPDLAGVASGPGVPDLAGVASRLGVPDLAGVASGPGVPDLAGVASRLGVPDLAGVASGPGVPDLAGVASRLGVPDLAGVASGPGVPDLAGVASRLGVPDLAGVASGPGVPDLAGVASRLGVPDLAGVASGPGVPDLAGVASRPGVPDLAGAASGPGVPDQAAGPGQPEAEAAGELGTSVVAQSLPFTKSVSMPAISSTVLQSPPLPTDPPETHESEQAMHSQSKQACKQNPFDRKPAITKSQTFQVSPSRRAPAPGYGFPLIKRKVQTDPYVHTEDPQVEMGEVHKRLETLELKGLELEKNLRDCKNEKQEEAMLLDWFSLIREKHVLVRRDAELVYLTKQKTLEERQADVEYGLRCLLNKPESEWTQEDRVREQKLMDELVIVIEQRNQIISSLDQDRQREKQEDILFEVMMNRKDLQKESLKELKKSKGKFKPMKVLKMLSTKAERDSADKT
ncbi:MICAL-like protein 1 [Polymixia lowei]